MTGCASAAGVGEVGSHDAYGADRDPLIWQAGLWGLVSALSLNIGSIIGVTCLPSQKVCAILMSFGGGALLFALTIELFSHALHEKEKDGKIDSLLVMELASILGGLIFAGLNRVVNSNGADIRKPSLSKGRFLRLRALFARRLLRRIQRLKLFSDLTHSEMNELVISMMHKKQFMAGDTILAPTDANLNIYFIVSGCVRFDFLYAEPSPDSPKLEKNARFEYRQTSPGSESNQPYATRSRSFIANQTLTMESFELGPDEVFGEMTYRRAIATTPTKVLVMPEDQLSKLIQSHASVRKAMSSRVLERLRRVHGLSPLTEDMFSMLSPRLSLQIFDARTQVFIGLMNNKSLAMCIGLGSVSVSQEGADSQIFGESQIICARHLIHPEKPIRAFALEPTTVLFVPSEDMDLITKNEVLVPSKMSALPADTISFGTPTGFNTKQRIVAWNEAMAANPVDLAARLTSVENSIKDLVTDEELDARHGMILAENRKTSKPDASKTESVKSPSKLNSCIGSDTEPEPVKNEEDSPPHQSSNVAIMVWLGILIDAIPESLVIGIIVNKTNGAASAVLPFIIGVFLSNLPESMSSTGLMKMHGMRVTTILMMWMTITFLTAIGAIIGAVVFPPGAGDDPSTRLFVSGVEGLAAGAMLTMIAQTMMPEAFGHGGDIVGLSCLGGFLSAVTVKLLPID
eukprot:TRINITY_DN57398_c0_g1_i1.p1 TRINITY_DN57398_c0_g1~~TRINITY_DN57398_c0_g1_i1.p1  ORF type:complete len:687 (-),score=62.56 TRINITY_DN57398_c0_g1_i1:171-2231(-)